MPIKINTSLTLSMLILASGRAYAQDLDTDNDSLKAEVNSSENQESALNETDISWESVNSSRISIEDLTGRIKIDDIVEADSEYFYSSFGKPDPFIPPMITELWSNLEIPVTSPLQRYDTRLLKITGIWKLESGERKALIRTPDGKGIISRVGDPIGKKGGKIIAIEKEHVTLREFTYTGNGTEPFSDIKLMIRPPKQNDDTLKIPLYDYKLTEQEENEQGFLDRTSSETSRKSQLSQTALDFSKEIRRKNVEEFKQQELNNQQPGRASEYWEALESSVRKEGQSGNEPQNPASNL